MFGIAEEEIKVAVKRVLDEGSPDRAAGTPSVLLNCVENTKEFVGFAVGSFAEFREVKAKMCH